MSRQLRRQEARERAKLSAQVIKMRNMGILKTPPPKISVFQKLRQWFKSNETA